MTLQDFSNGMDTLLNSYSRSGLFGEDTSKADIRLDEYEKSVLLTKSQEEEVLSLYTGKNPSGESFEHTEELRRYLSPLVQETTLSPITTTNGMPLGVDSRSKFFTLPDNLWFITYESVMLADAACEGMDRQEVYPVRQDEYHKLKKNPFRGANDRRALRLDLADNVVEIVSTQKVSSYYVRYLKKLKPIVLVNLSADNASINGVSTPTGCELHESLHQRILERAVAIAIASRGYARSNNENR